MICTSMIILCHQLVSRCSGGWFNIKMPSYQYRKSHCGDKTILRPSYLHNGISYTGKMASLYWIGALVSGSIKSLAAANLTFWWILRSFLAATKQLYDWFSPSVRLSVCLSVRPSVCLSHLFHHVPIIVSSWNFQELLPWSKVMSMQKVKVRGQRSRSQRSTPNLAVSGL